MDDFLKGAIAVFAGIGYIVVVVAAGWFFSHEVMEMPLWFWLVIGCFSIWWLYQLWQNPKSCLFFTAIGIFSIAVSFAPFAILPQYIGGGWTGAVWVVWMLALSFFLESNIKRKDRQ